MRKTRAKKDYFVVWMNDVILGHGASEDAAWKNSNAHIFSNHPREEEWITCSPVTAALAAIVKKDPDTVSWGHYSNGKLCTEAQEERGRMSE